MQYNVYLSGSGVREEGETSRGGQAQGEAQRLERAAGDVEPQLRHSCGPPTSPMLGGPPTSLSLG